MSELDVAKEQIAYLKVWLGILVVTDISVFGWLISNLGTATAPLLWAAVTAVVALTAVSSCFIGESSVTLSR